MFKAGGAAAYDFQIPLLFSISASVNGLCREIPRKSLLGQIYYYFSSDDTFINSFGETLQQMWDMHNIVTF